MKKTFKDFESLKVYSEANGNTKYLELIAIVMGLCLVILN